MADYLEARFGALGFYDNYYLQQQVEARWTRSSPQHVDRAALERLIPVHFFDAIFAVVRHPVARTVSTYHFQLEVEKSIPADIGFSDWLAALDPGACPFALDNHILPMNQIVPEGATVFHPGARVGRFGALV